MANGRTANAAGWLVAGGIVLVILVATNVWNPFPGLWAFVNHDDPIASPAPAWQVRLGGAPKSVTIANDALVLEQGTSVEGRSLETGAHLWERKADWAAVAGLANAPVVVTGSLLVKGYDVLDPRSGAVRRHDSQAAAVWTYRNAIVDVSCVAPHECTLSAWDPRGSAPVWSVELPGVGFVLFADNPTLLGSRPITTRKVDDHAGGPEAMPQLMGFPIDGKVYVVDTAAGRLLPELAPDRQEKVSVVGGRVMHVRARSASGNCYFTAWAVDASVNAEVWRREGYNFKTSSGAGCPQRDAPVGAGNVLSALGADGSEVIIDAYDGRVLWAGRPGEQVLAMDNLYSVVRSTDGQRLRGMVHGQPEPLWTRKVNPDAKAALTPYAAIVVDAKPDRLIAVDPGTGAQLLNVRSQAQVRAVGPGGMVVTDFRDLAYLRFGASAPVPPVDEPVQPAPTTPAGPPPTDASGRPLDPSKKE